jgi:hypothetical protein
MPFTLMLCVLLGARIFWWAKGRRAKQAKTRSVAVSS